MPEIPNLGNIDLKNNFHILLSAGSMKLILTNFQRLLSVVISNMFHDKWSVKVINSYKLAQNNFAKKIGDTII